MFDQSEAAGPGDAGTGGGRQHSKREQYHPHEHVASRAARDRRQERLREWHRARERERRVQEIRLRRLDRAFWAEHPHIARGLGARDAGPPTPPLDRGFRSFWEEADFMMRTSCAGERAAYLVAAWDRHTPDERERFLAWVKARAAK